MAPSSGPLGDAGPHLCPLCSKQFTRRDLRERHRRRCERSIGKQRPTKKSSCESCIASKVKCDHRKPSCSRCLGRSMQCEYRLNPHPPIRLSPSRPEPDLCTSIPESSESIDGLLRELEPLRNASFEFRFHDPVPHLSSQAATNQWTEEQPVGLWHSGQPESRVEMPNPFPTTSLEPNWALLSNLVTNDSQRQPDYAAGVSRTMSTSTTVSNPVALEFLQSAQHCHRQSPQVDHVFQSTHASIASSDLENEHSSASSSPQSAIPQFARSSKSLSEPLYLGCRSKSVIKHSDSLSEFARAALSTHKPLPPGAISVETALEMITQYPKRMLVDTFQSPFVHPKLNRDSPRGMPQPIAIALACVGMKMHAESAGLPFVCNIFRDQKDKLINDLPSMTEKHEELAAALHAMCIYQIEGLLSDKRYDSKLSPAVLHQEYLVRMTRRLVQRLSADVPEFFTALHVSKVSWEIWTVHESLRRILFLLMIIHQLLGATKTLDPAYFEPLFPEEVCDKLVLPCEEVLWDASSTSEWEEAKLRTAKTEAYRLGDATRRWSGEDRRGNVDNLRSGVHDTPGSFEQLPELTKLIISVAQIKVKDL